MTLLHGSPDGECEPAPRDGWESRLRDQLIALEIRARCEEWRRGSARDDGASRALRRLHRELRGGIWQLGLRAAVKSPARAADAQLLAELQGTAGTLRFEARRDDPALERLATSLDAALVALDHVEPGAARASVYRRPGRLDAARPRCMDALPDEASKEAQPKRTRPRAIARDAAVVALAGVGMVAAAAGLRWLPLAILVALVAWFAAAQRPRRSGH